MGEMNYVLLYGSYEKELAAYSYTQVGRMFMGLLHLLNTGEEYVPVGSEKYIWPTLRGQYQRNLDTYLQRCEVNKVNSKKGVEARKTKGSPKTTERLPIGSNEKENANEKENVNENVNEKERGKETISFMTAAREREIVSFSPPNVDTVSEFCRAEGLSNVDAKVFVDYYTSVGWKVGDRPMHSWQAAARLWNANPANGKEKNNGRDYSAAAQYGVVL